MLHRSINFNNFSTDELHQWGAGLAKLQSDLSGEKLELPIQNPMVERWKDKKEQAESNTGQIQINTDENK
jgi:hypothetical protein